MNGHVMECHLNLTYPPFHLNRLQTTFEQPAPVFLNVRQLLSAHGNLFVAAHLHTYITFVVIDKCSCEKHALRTFAIYSTLSYLSESKNCI